MRNKYTEIKGHDLHEQVSNLLKFNNNIITCDDIASYIKYDKNLRNKLYLYLSTLEEYLRAYLNNFYKLKENSDIFDKYRLKRKDNKIICTKNNFSKKTKEELISNDFNELYYKNNLMFSEIVELYNILKANFSRYTFEDFIKYLHDINKLRNNVMHHELLVLGKSKNYKEFSMNKTQVKDQILSLAKLLPFDYSLNFINDLSKLRINKNILDFKIHMKEEMILFECIYKAKYLPENTIFNIRDLLDILEWVQLKPKIAKKISDKFNYEILKYPQFFKIKYCNSQKSSIHQMLYKKVE